MLIKTMRFIVVSKACSAPSSLTTLAPGENGIADSFVLKGIVRQGIVIKTAYGKYYLNELKDEQVRKTDKK